MVNERVRARRSAMQAIRDFLLGNIEELTPREKDIYARYQYVQLMRMNTSQEVFIEAYCEKFGVSAYTAHQDELASQQLFGDLSAKTKDALRKLWLDRAEAVYLKASADGDVGNMVKAIATAAKLIGNPDKDSFIPDKEMLGNNLFVFGGSAQLDKSMMQLVEGLKNSGKINLADFPLVSEKAEFEQIENTDEQ